MTNLDELMNNRKLLDTIGRSELVEVIGVLLDERADLLSALIPKKPKALEDVHAARHALAADKYLNEDHHQLTSDYHELHDSFHGAEEIVEKLAENPETD